MVAMIEGGSGMNWRRGTRSELALAPTLWKKRGDRGPLCPAAAAG